MSEQAAVELSPEAVEFAVPGGQHSYVYGAGRIPETDAAIAQIGAWVREKTKV